MSGYSGTPLAKKLGIKESFRVRTENAPDNYLELLQPLSSGVKISNRLRTNIDIWHIFVISKANLGQKLGSAMKRIPADGMIWVSWPKKTSGVPSDMTENEVRNAALPLGLVDVKVCAVDETWSGPSVPVTPATDMARFVIMYTDRGRPIRRQIVSDEGFATLLSPAADVRDAGGRDGNTRYALGHYTYDTPEGARIVYHAGGNPGLRAIFVVAPDRNDGFFAVANNDRGSQVLTAMINSWGEHHGITLHANF